MTNNKVLLDVAVVRSEETTLSEPLLGSRHNRGEEETSPEALFVVIVHFLFSPFYCLHPTGNNRREIMYTNCPCFSLELGRLG